MWNRKRNDTNELTKQKETHRLRKLTHGCQGWVEGRGGGGGRGEGIFKEFGKVMYTLLYLKWITNKNLLYSTWNSAQCCVAAWMGVGLGENGYMCMYGWVPALFTWNYHNTVNWLYPSTKCVCCLKKQNCAKRLRTLGIQHFISNRRLALGTNLSTLDSGIYHFWVDVGSRAPACPWKWRGSLNFVA